MAEGALVKPPSCSWGVEAKKDFPRLRAEVRVVVILWRVRVRLSGEEGEEVEDDDGIVEEV